VVPKNLTLLMPGRASDRRVHAPSSLADHDPKTIRSQILKLRFLKLRSPWLTARYRRNSQPAEWSAPAKT